MAQTTTNNTGLTSRDDGRVIVIERILSGEDDARIVIDDEENIVAAMSAGVTIEQVYATPGRAQGALAAEATEIAVHLAKKLFGRSKLSRVFAIARRPEPVSLETTMRSGSDVIVLDGAALAGNVGAVIRSALAFDAGSIVIANSEIDIYDRRVVRASRGGVFQLPIARATSLDVIREAQGASRSVIAAAAPRQMWTRSTSWQHLFRREEPIVLVFGGERSGCSRTILEAATAVAHIPIRHIESLNVSVAAAILLYERARLRGPQQELGSHAKRHLIG